jgi:predicted dehydrogenase
VVVDKPLAPSAAEARALVEQAERLGVLLTVFMNRRWDSDQLTLRRLLDDRKLGEVLRYESRFERWRPALSERKPWREVSSPQAGGGVLLDLGSHLVDQALVLFGPVARVYAEVESRRGGADDDVFLALEHRSGARSHLWASLLAAAPGPRLRVLGDRGAYVVTEVDGQEDALRSGARPGGDEQWGVEPPERWGRLFTEERSEAVASEWGDWPRFYIELERALREGSQAPVDPWDAVTGLEVLEAARRSAATATVVATSTAETDAGP